MFSLIRKDILLQRKTLLYVLGYGLFLFLAFQSSTLNNSIYIAGTVGIAYMLIFGATGHDDKSNSAVIFNSLPISRMKIVAAKYLSVLIFAVIGIIVMGALGTILKIIGVPLLIRYINTNDIITAVFSVSFMNSIYLPLFYKFGNSSMRIVNIVIFMVAFFLPGFVMENRNAPPIHDILSLFNNMPGWIISGSILLLTLLMLAISLAISYKIYNNKEF